MDKELMGKSNEEVNDMQELSMDEMEKVSGGEYEYWDRERCDNCGGRFIIGFYSNGVYSLKCENCGCRAIAGA